MPSVTACFWQVLNLFISNMLYCEQMAVCPVEEHFIVGLPKVYIPLCSNRGTIMESCNVHTILPMTVSPVKPLQAESVYLTQT